jgi:hypothetical protein
MSSTTKQHRLTNIDRCDKCGAQAFVITTYSNGYNLFFCKHHANKYAEIIAEKAIDIHDESDKINVSPSVSSY